MTFISAAVQTSTSALAYLCFFDRGMDADNRQICVYGDSHQQCSFLRRAEKQLNFMSLLESANPSLLDRMHPEFGGNPDKVISLVSML